MSQPGEILSKTALKMATTSGYLEAKYTKIRDGSRLLLYYYDKSGLHVDMNCDQHTRAVPSKLKVSWHTLTGFLVKMRGLSPLMHDNV